MADYGHVLEMLDDLRGRMDTLANVITQLAPAPAEGEHAAAPSRAFPAPTAPGTGNLIPPTPSDDPNTIFGGSVTKDFSHCCAVIGTAGYCTGTLIAPNVVVTAKHCMHTPSPCDVQSVFLKGFDISRPAEGETIAVKRCIPHPDPVVDLLVLVLTQDSTVTPAHVAQDMEVRGDTATLVGFGTIDFSGHVGYGLKRRVDVPITSLGCSGSDDANTYGCRGGFEMVAGHRGLAKDTCQGDSGGPLYIKSPAGDDYYLLGATLRGAKGTFGCGDGGVYLRVDQFLDWIRHETGVNIPGHLY